MNSVVPNTIIEKISKFSSCEIADALIKLNYPNGGYLPDINLQTTTSPTTLNSSSNSIKLCGPVFTVEMVSATDTESPSLTEHFVDTGEKDTVMVISSPANSKNAVWGGLMTARAKFKGIKGVVIDGRCRDLAEHREANFLVFARGHSILGQSTFTRASRIQVPITIHPIFNDINSNSLIPINKSISFPPTIVKPNDIILGDENGVVIIPNEEITQVIEICEKNSKIDQFCLEALKAGVSIKETFSKYRVK